MQRRHSRHSSLIESAGLTSHQIKGQNDISTDKWPPDHTIMSINFYHTFASRCPKELESYRSLHLKKPILALYKMLIELMSQAVHKALLHWTYCLLLVFLVM
jgi:hypothetical protein